MTAHDLTCYCGHRFALHTYFNDATPCTRCGCRTYDETQSERSERRDASSKNPAGRVEPSSRVSGAPKRHLL
jgi:hypothetical protein